MTAPKTWGSASRKGLRQKPLLGAPAAASEAVTRPARFEMRCTPAELAAWREQAKRQGRTLSQHVRWLLGNDETAGAPKEHRPAARGVTPEY